MVKSAARERGTFCVGPRRARAFFMPGRGMRRALLLLKIYQINVLANYMYIWIFLWLKSVVLEGSSETAPKWRTIPAAEGQDFAANPKKSKKNWVEFGQNETISGQITNCSKINKLALLTLRASNLKYTCNPPKHLISQFSENSEITLFTLT